MSHKGRTPDEKFLIQLYKIASQKGDPFSSVLCGAVARALGQKETATKNIVKHLAQANFVEKLDEAAVVLTPRGMRFVLEELGMK
ncbi:MAG: hypothetical protein HY861_02300 [Chlamydiia bacterium]|nr:hypothetical protein [Chlamydiia bacterium]